MPRDRTLRSQSREMVFKVHNFMKKEAEEGLQYDLKMVQRRTAEATGTSLKTVYRITTAAKKYSGPGIAPVFRTPGKKRVVKKKITGLDSSELSVIRRCVHNFHRTEKQLPTIKLLLQKLKQEIDFTGSATSLLSIMKNLNFKWKKAQDNVRLILEPTNIRLKRIEYLKKISAYRQEGRPIVYTDESYVDASLTHVVKQNAKGQRVAIVHAAMETGFIPKALLLCKVTRAPGDSKHKINTKNYVNWLRSNLIPNLPEKSVVVVGNASYHNQLEGNAPTPFAKKADMEAWLQDKNIGYSSDMLKPELYKLIRLHTEKDEKYIVDSILRSHNHDVLRLPPLHSELNPIAMACDTISAYVAKKNVTWNATNVKKLIKHKINAMDEAEWSAIYSKVKSMEKEYLNNEAIIDEMTEEFVINDAESESDSDHEKEKDTNIDADESDSNDSDSDSSSAESLPSTNHEEIYVMEGIITFD